MQLELYLNETRQLAEAQEHILDEVYERLQRQQPLSHLVRSVRGQSVRGQVFIF
jgi:hypothetical protein